nr:lysine-rich arabinogalactan protein 19-like [Aegilops tauschii subsp. strangulata]
MTSPVVATTTSPACLLLLAGLPPRNHVAVVPDSSPSTPRSTTGRCELPFPSSSLVDPPRVPAGRLCPPASSPLPAWATPPLAHVHARSRMPRSSPASGHPRRRRSKPHRRSHPRDLPAPPPLSRAACGFCINCRRRLPPCCPTHLAAGYDAPAPPLVWAGTQMGSLAR